MYFAAFRTMPMMRCNLVSLDIKSLVKVEGDVSLYVDSMYGKVPEIVFNEKTPLNRKIFAEKYGMEQYMSIVQEVEDWNSCHIGGGCKYLVILSTRIVIGIVT